MTQIIDNKMLGIKVKFSILFCVSILLSNRGANSQIRVSVNVLCYLKMLAKVSDTFSIAMKDSASARTSTLVLI